VRVGYRLHGRDHRTGGADPIPGLEGWRFNVDNEGGWVYLISNESIDIDFGILGAVIGETTGEGLYLFSHDTPQTKSGTVLLTPDEITFALSSSLSASLDRATGTVTVRDSSNNPILQMTDGSPDLHLPAGGNVVFDL
jgi:hypothetical protein